MTLGDKQRAFTRMIADLIQYAYNSNFELTFGDAYRDPRLHGNFGDRVGYSASNSLHKLRLAIDLNLFVDGEYITDGNHKAWGLLHNYWKSLGGSIGIKGDENHFSLEHKGFR